MEEPNSIPITGLSSLRANGRVHGRVNTGESELSPSRPQDDAGFSTER